jgi:SAM-dependent methyltransferase
MDPRDRFSKRSKYYHAYRPKYPDALVNFLETQLPFSLGSIVADVGSGTGILTELLLKNGNVVFGIEPNEDMRKIAEANLSHYPRFRSIDGSAESTTLPNNSVDFITAAQSFHWFVLREARAEFRRILRKDGWVVLVWNTRKTSTPFLQGYEELVNWIADKKKNRVKHEDLTDATISEFLGKPKMVKLDNSQQLELEGMIGRLVSASYSPLPGDPVHPELVRRATDLFNRYQQNGTVKLEYWTEVYAGQLS